MEVAANVGLTEEQIREIAMRRQFEQSQRRLLRYLVFYLVEGLLICSNELINMERN